MKKKKFLNYFVFLSELVNMKYENTLQDIDFLIHLGIAVALY